MDFFFLQPEICSKRIQVSCMRLGLISERFHKKRVSLHTWFPCKAKSEKSQLFQSKWSNAFQIQIGIDPLRSGGEGGGGVEGDGQTIKVKEGVFCIRSNPL